MLFFVLMMVVLVMAALIFFTLYKMLKNKFSSPIPLVFSIVVAALFVLVGFYLIALVV